MAPKSSFYKDVLVDISSQSENERLVHFTNVSLFVEKSSAVKLVGTAKLFKHANKTVSRTLQKDLIPSKRLANQVVITKVQVLPNCRSLKYPHTFRTSDEVPGILRNMVTVGMYEQDRTAIVGLDKRSSIQQGRRERNERSLRRKEGSGREGHSIDLGE